jgi:hypothetical protein
MFVLEIEGKRTLGRRRDGYGGSFEERKEKKSLKV